jgi:phosphoribosylaminoimidazole synthetase
MYALGDYDAAGCAIGAVRRENLLPKLKDMSEGDLLVGVASNGAHSNGYSLIRKIIERHLLDLSAPAPWDSSTTIGEEFLIPTRIYVRPLLKLSSKGLIKGMAHITGGGLTENIPRMLPNHLTAEVDVSTWPLSPLFKWLKQAGALASLEFGRTWNTGLGFVIVVSATEQEQVLEMLKAEGENAYVVGKLVARGSSEGCVLKNVRSWD